MVVKMNHVLGLNARNHRFTSQYNKSKAKKIANSKLLTKSTLRKVKLPTPRLYRVFRNESEIERFDYSKLPDSFVIKPNRGLGGEGIIVVEDRVEGEENEWLTTKGEKIGVRDIQLHLEDTLAGRFSMNDLPDIAFVEERVRIHAAFEKLAYHGTPDIRVVVFNMIPVMAMLRIPSRDSGGRANLHQGAVGAGIDIASGVTTGGIYHDQRVVFMPGTRRKIVGLEIPAWDEVLRLALECQKVSEIGFLGADIVLQPSVKKPGVTLPKVLELNAQPGLKIQLANNAGLLRRLERVEGLDVDSVEKGVRLGKELFGDKDLAHLGKKIKSIGVFEKVEVVDASGEKHEVKVKIDTGAYRSSIDKALAEELGLLKRENILMEMEYRNAMGKGQVRDVVGVTFHLAGKKVETSASVVDRSHMNRLMLIGRRDLKGYIISFD
jgi:alpha-L-glutamate ligase-like protein